MSKSAKFPKEIRVVWESPINDDPYLSVLYDDTLDSVDDGDAVATYQLISVGRAKVERSVV